MFHQTLGYMFPPFHSSWHGDYSCVPSCILFFLLLVRTVAALTKYVLLHAVCIQWDTLLCHDIVP